MMAAQSRLEPTSFRKLDNRLGLLMGQSLSLGILLSLLIITASALFLTRFGSQSLPYVYIIVAILGSVVFYGYAELQRRYPLPILSIFTVGIIALFFALSWLGLTLTGASWITFLLMVSFSLIIQMGFVILGNQAGRLFDVREVKGKFPRIVAGFAVGFLLGGFIASFLADVIGKTENLLLLATVFSMMMLAFLVAIDKRYHQRLIQSGTIQRIQSSKPLWQLLAKRFVLLVVLYQMLSAMVSQLLDFMLFDQAAARYTDSLGLAQFLGNYTIAVNVSDILFLSLFAGLLLSRYGLKFGLAANPIIDVGIMLIEVAVGLALGVDSGLFFILVMAARIVDITLTDGTTRGSINTAYQALPDNERVTVQTGVEGIGVPLALGLTGVILLLFNLIRGLTILHVAIFTLLISIAWTVSAVLAYRGYTSSLIKTLRRRALDPAELTIEDGASRGVVESFLDSDKVREVCLALDMLEDADYQLLDEKLIALTRHKKATIRSEAFARIERRRILSALEAVKDALARESDPTTKSAAIRAYCALEESAATEQVVPLLDSEHHEIRQGAAVGLMRYGGIPGILAAGAYVTHLEGSSNPADRLLVAQIIKDVGSSSFYQPLMKLLVDEDEDVRRAALIASSRSKNPRLLPLIIDNLSRPAVRSAAMIAVVACHEQILPHLRTALEESRQGHPETAIRLLRASGQIGGENTIQLLLGYIAHPISEVRTGVLSALSACKYEADPGKLDTFGNLLHEEVEVATQLMVVKQDIGAELALAPLQRALSDEIDNIRQRVFLLLTFIVDRPAVLRASERLISGSSIQQALALETLDVMLPTDHKKVVFPLIDPRLAFEERIDQLHKQFSAPTKSVAQRLKELIRSEDGVQYHPWIRTCAVYAAGKLGLPELTVPIESVLSDEYVPLRETATWALSNLARDRFEFHLAQLLIDADPRVANLATALATRDI